MENDWTLKRVALIRDLMHGQLYSSHCNTEIYRMNSSNAGVVQRHLERCKTRAPRISRRRVGSDDATQVDRMPAMALQGCNQQPCTQGSWRHWGTLPLIGRVLCRVMEARRWEKVITGDESFPVERTMLSSDLVLNASLSSQLWCSAESTERVF